MNDDIFHVPAELFSDSAHKRNLAKAMTNDDVVVVIRTLIVIAFIVIIGT